MIERASHPGVSGCDACGMWLDNGACQRLVAGTLALDSPIWVPARERAAAGTATYRSAPGDGERRCPVCAEPLERARVEYVDLEVCGAHGTFFAGDTLWRAHVALRARDEARRRESAELAAGLVTGGSGEGLHGLVEAIADVLWRGSSD